MHLFVLLWSTAIPIDFANWRLIPASFNSSNVNPLPSFTLELYFCVGQCTNGRRAPDAGRGLFCAALILRLSLLIFFCAGWSNHVLTRRCHFLWKCCWTIAIIILIIMISMIITVDNIICDNNIFIFNMINTITNNIHK